MISPQTTIPIEMEQKHIEPSKPYQKIFMTIFAIVLNIIGIASISFLLFLLLSDEKWENQDRLNFSRGCFQKINQTIAYGPVHRPVPTGLG